MRYAHFGTHVVGGRASIAKRLNTWLLGVVGVVLMAACGGGEPGTSAQEAQASASARATEAAAAAPAGLGAVLATRELGRATVRQAPTGATFRDFSVFVDAAELLLPYAISAGQVLRVQPVSTGAAVSVVHWGDGEYTVINGGWNANSPALTHTYEDAGTFRLEYATLSPTGGAFAGWDSRVITVSVTAGDTPPVGGAFTRDFSITSNGLTLPGPPTVAANQPVTIVPASKDALASVIYWGDGTYSAIADGWKPTTPPSLTTRSYATPGAYLIEYATLSPRGSWDSKLVTLTVEQLTPPPPPPATFSREFTVTSNGLTLAAPIRVPTNQPIQIVPASSLAQTSVIYWGDNTYTLINGGWKPTTPAQVTSRIFTTPGVYRVEYATLSPEGVWDDRVAVIEVGGPPAGPPASFTRGFTLTGNGATLSAPPTVAVNTPVRLIPTSDLALSSVINWGDGSSQTIADGWRTLTPDFLTTHRYAAPGTYVIEYATRSPDLDAQTPGTWDSVTVALTVTGTPPPPPPPSSPDAIKVLAIGGAGALANTCVAYQDDRVRCWGAFTSPTPVVPASIPGVSALVVGVNEVCAVVAGRVSCYGNSGVGAAFATLADVTEVTLSKPCALTGTGLLRCFRLATGGGYVEDTTLRFNFPVASFATNGSWVCAVSTSGTLACQEPVRVLTMPVIDDAVSVTATSSTACVIRRNGTALCGLLGFADFEPVPGVTDVSQVARYVVSASILSPGQDGLGSASLYCVLRRTGAMACAGDGGDGVPALTRIARIESDGSRLCALTLDGALSCFLGSQASDPFGAGPEVFGVTGVRAVGADCAVGRNGAVHCWGSRYTQLPLISSVDPFSLGDRRRLFTALPFVDVRSLAFANGLGAPETASACALSDRNTLACWGDGVLERTLPAEIKTRPVSTLFSLYDRACAMTTEGAVRCWGGASRPAEEQLAAEVAALAGVRQIVTHRNGASQGLCALLAQGDMQCWATNVNAPLEEDSVERTTVAGPFSRLFGPGCGELVGGGVRCTDDLTFLGLDQWFAQLPGRVVEVSSEAPWFSGLTVYAMTSDGTAHAFGLGQGPVSLSGRIAGRQVRRVAGGCLLFTDGSASCEGFSFFDDPNLTYVLPFGP